MNATVKFALLAGTSLASGLALVADFIWEVPNRPWWARILLSTAFLSSLALSRSAYKPYIRRRKQLLNGCGDVPEYPHQDPFGFDWAMKAKMSFTEHRFVESVQEQLREYGRTHSVRMFLSNEYFLFTDESENVKTILSTNFADWHMPPSRKNAVSAFLGRSSIFSVDGEDWAHARSIIRPSFTRNFVADLVVFDRHISNMISCIPKGSEPFDLQDLLLKMALDVSSDFLFGHSTGMLDRAEPEDKEFSGAFDIASLKTSQAIRAGPLGLLIKDEERLKSNKITRQYITKFAQDSLRDFKSSKYDLEAKKHVFLPQLMESGAPVEYMVDQIMAMFLAGRDTTAATMSYLFWNLARRPDVVTKIQEEIQQDLGDQEPTWEQLRNMKYLNWTIKESLRLNPPLAMNARVSIRDTILPVGGGPDGTAPVFCPRGTTVRWVSYSTHRDPKIFGEDAEEFRPERWKDLKVTWEYTPFSGGPRVCIGQQFALTQVALVAVRMLQHFKSIEARDDKPLVHRLGITMVPTNGCWVSVTPR